MEAKKIINSFDAQPALRNSQLKFAAGMANHKPELIKVKQGQKQSFYFYWKDRNYAYNPENGMCGTISCVQPDNLNYQPAKVNDENSNLRVVDTKYGLAVEQK